MCIDFVDSILLDCKKVKCTWSVKEKEWIVALAN